MKLLLIISHLVFAFTSWYLIRDEEAMFMMEMPGEPVIKSDSILSEIGTVKIRSFVSSEESQIYMVNLTTYPEELNFFEKQDSLTEYMVNTIKEQLLGQLHLGNLAFEYDREFDGIPGKFFQIFYDTDSSVVRTAVIPYYNQLLTLQYFCDYHSRLDKDADRFFNSFKHLR
ncbi:MAG: hypothetical protein IPM48_13650 [Saprospiraceae bacterium]|nr:hypothetical protein [Saprospiraceae bacterium]